MAFWRPLPTVTWLKDGAPVDPNRSQIGKSANHHSFEIQSVREEDAGRYSLVAKNNLGKQIHHVVVKVGENIGNADKKFEAQSLAELKFQLKSDDALPPPAIPGLSFAPKAAPVGPTRKNSNRGVPPSPKGLRLRLFSGFG